jgi:hypothetical protein
MQAAIRETGPDYKAVVGAKKALLTPSAERSMKGRIARLPAQIAKSEERVNKYAAAVREAQEKGRKKAPRKALAHAQKVLDRRRTLLNEAYAAIDGDAKGRETLQRAKRAW